MKQLIKKTIIPLQNIIRKALGFNDIFYEYDLKIEKLQDENNAVFYYLNNYLLKAKDLPPTSDSDLRIMQLCDVQLLRIVDKILTKYNLTYWLDYGTLLGAVRHKGFIPWDDDMDITILAEEYENVYETLNTEFAKFEGLTCEKKEKLGWLGVGYKHYQTGIWLDLFSIEHINYNGALEPRFEQLCREREQYYQYYCKYKGRLDAVCLLKQKNDIIKNDRSGKETLYYVTPERNYTSKIHYCNDDIFPLRRIEFEGYDFFCPNNYTEILTQNYSNHYMSLARGGILHHDQGRGALSVWATNNNIDMQRVLLEITDIYDNI